MTAAVEERSSQSLALTVGRDEMADALTYVGALAVSSRTALPILGGVKLSAGSGVATVEAFDYETHATQVIQASGDGSALVCHRDLLDIVKSCDKGARLTLTTVGDKLTVTDGEATFTVNTLPLDEYPAAPQPGRTHMGTFNRETLAGIAATLPAAGRRQTLPVLTAVCFDPAVTWHTATTDRYRLAIFDTGAPVTVLESPRLLVPAQIVAQACKRLGDSVTVTYTVGASSFVTFADDARTLTTRTLDGEFPRYRMLVPDKYEAILTLDNKRGVKATKRASVVCSRTSPVVIELDSDGATITAGLETTASVPAGGTYDGEPMRVGVNPAYLLDLFAGVASDSVHIGFVAPVKPFVAWSDERPGLRWVQMPVRLGG